MCRHEGSEWDAKGSHGRHSMVVVPMDTPGITPVRALHVFGYDDAPHGHAEVELRFDTIGRSVLAPMFPRDCVLPDMKVLWRTRRV